MGTKSWKLFYRTRNKKLSSGNLTDRVSSSSSEDCLHECFIRQNCKTFNKIEIEADKYVCELYSNDRACYLEDLALQADEKSSVYFSSEECSAVSFKLNSHFGYLRGLLEHFPNTQNFKLQTTQIEPFSYFTTAENNKIVLADDKNKCLSSTEFHTQNLSFDVVTLSDDNCLHLMVEDGYLKLKNLNNCFRKYANYLIIINVTRKCHMIRIEQ